MFFLTAVLVALVVAALGVGPLLIMGQKKKAVVAGVVYMITCSLVFYFMAWPLIGPLLGWYGLTLWVLWVCSWFLTASIDSFGFDGDNLTEPAGFLLPVAGLILTIIVYIAGSSFFQADKYASLMPATSDREWTKDVQPKDPNHMRLVSKENALQLAEKAPAQMGAIGSQFVISKEETTLQVVNNGGVRKLLWVVPLDFNGFGPWWSTGKVPAYITVDAENTHADPVLVKFDPNRQMVYTPGAMFSTDLERHLRSNGYANKGLIDWSLEIDDDLKEWWVVTVYHLEIVGNAPRVEGVVIVDPTSGNNTFYPIGKTPEWVDRVVPDDIVHSYLDWQGSYSEGFWNAWLWGEKLTKPEQPKMIYGETGEPEWVTSITSTSSKDSSLIAMVYTNSRTGESIRYNVNGGNTDSSIIANVNNIGSVKNQHLHGVDPQIYNIYGHMSAVVPLLSEQHTFQGVVILDVANAQIFAHGVDQMDAMRKYQTALLLSGKPTSIDNASNNKKVSGVVDRIDKDISNGSTKYYIHIKDTDRLFTASIEVSPKIAVTRVNDNVVLEFIDSAEEVVPLLSFDNTSLPLSKGSKTQ